MVTFTLSQSAPEFAKSGAICVMCTSVVYMPSYVKSVLYSISMLHFILKKNVLDYWFLKIFLFS